MITKKKIVTVKAGLNLSGFDGALNHYADAGYVLHTVLYVRNAGYVLAVMTLREEYLSDFKPEFVGEIPEHTDYAGAVDKKYVAEEDGGYVVEKKRAREYLREALDTEDNSSDNVSEPVADMVSEPVADIVSEPVADIVSEPVADIVSEPVADIVSEPVADIVSEPVADIVSEPVAGAVEAITVPDEDAAAVLLESNETADLSTLSDLNELADLNDLNSGEPETN